MPIHFPPLTSDMQAHTEAVTAHIRQEIEKKGKPLPFDRFMELALYAPGLGYYSAGAHKLGKMGDFVTAPEISPLFAQCVARQFADILEDLPNAGILEIGAGSGNFANDVLLALEKKQKLPLHYFILERSADLRERQQALLKKNCPHLQSRIIWLDRLPDSFCGIIFANEVLDALPVHCFRIENHTVKERCVSFKDGQFSWELAPPSPQLKHKVLQLMEEYNLPNGYESEINLVLPHWVETLANILSEGVMIFFDYGYSRHEYYHPAKLNGSLRCYYQHRCHDNPFIFVGLQDLTTQVDFTTLVESAMHADLQLVGYTTQSAFLLNTGIAELMHAPPFSMQHYQQNQALKLLMLPSEMGTLVKAVALGQHWEKPLRGFSQFDKRHEL